MADRENNSYIDHSITITETLPEPIQYIIRELGKYDAEGSDLYFSRTDDLWTVAKNSYAEGDISRDTWDRLTQKYVTHANAVVEEDERAEIATDIYDFDNCEISDRNGTYGGNSGDKEGIFFKDNYWLVKYPKSARDLTRTGSLSYTTSPLSEYIGSHIYAILGYDVHETLLGIRNGRLVVACKDLCDDAHRLIEFRQLKNTYNKQLSRELDTTLHSTSGNHFTGISEIVVHLQYNPELRNIPGIQEHFWDCVIIDGLINNNDRNSGNWGILRSKTESLPAPVYDNGSSFSPNVPESVIIRKLDHPETLLDAALSGITAYSLDGRHNALFRDLLNADLPQIQEAVCRVVPKIRRHLEKCCSFIEDIPEFYGTYQVITPARKEEYISELKARTEHLLVPAYEKACTNENR